MNRDIGQEIMSCNMKLPVFFKGEKRISLMEEKENTGSISYTTKILKKS
jgi:hypothetical protein